MIAVLFVVLRGPRVNKTYGAHKSIYIPSFSMAISSYLLCPPVISIFNSGISGSSNGGGISSIGAI